MNARQIVESLLDEKPVIQRDRVIKDGDTICPHCNEQIHEKGYGERDGKTIHRKCGGVIKMPEPSAESIEQMRRVAPGLPRRQVCAPGRVRPEHPRAEG
jgi:hypothetical protein